MAYNVLCILGGVFFYALILLSVVGDVESIMALAIIAAAYAEFVDLVFRKGSYA